jgi:hypothetical protein
LIQLNNEKGIFNMSPSAPAPPSMTAQQQFILESFNSQTYVDNRMDIQDTPLYDTVVLASGNVLNTLVSVLFTNVGPQSGKTLALTNMATPQKLNAPEAFAIFGFSFRYSENISLLDIYNILNGFAYEFWMGQKAYQRGPIWNYNAGGGIYGVATANAATILNNGMPGRGHMHRLGINVVIENQMSFYAQLIGSNYMLNANGTGFTFQSLLRGLYARGVQ